MVLIKKVKELIAKGCCVADTDLIDEPHYPHQQQEQANQQEEQQIEETPEQQTAQITRETEAIQQSTQVVAETEAVQQREPADNGNETPLLIDDEDVTEEEEVYQTEYTAMDPDQVSFSFTQSYENYMGKVENRQSHIFTDNAWEMDNTILNAYEYINPAMGDIYQDSEQDSQDSGIYQSHYEFMQPEEIEKSYSNLNEKYASFMNTLSSFERSRDSWTSDVTLAHPFSYFWPAEINPYAVSHPCEPTSVLAKEVIKEEQEDEEEDVVPEEELLVSEEDEYQKEYSAMDPDQISLSFEQSYEHFMEILENRNNLIYTDDAWQMDKSILNAYEYINPAIEDIYEGQEFDTEESGIYQTHYDSMDAGQVDRLYDEWSSKFSTLRSKMVSPEQSDDPWKENLALLHPFDYFMPAEINPYAIAHPCEPDVSVPSLEPSGEDLSDEEGQLTPDEIYQKEYSAMDPDQISISFSKDYEKFKDFLEDKDTIVFQDDPWEADKTVINAYEYINPAVHDKYKDQDFDSEDSGFYQLHYSRMDPGAIDQAYADTYREYFAFISNLNSLEQSAEDPWKTDIICSHPFHYYVPAEINPYVISHPFEENEQSKYDYIYQTEYAPMVSGKIENQFKQEYRDYVNQMEEQLSKKVKHKIIAVDPWYR